MASAEDLTLAANFEIFFGDLKAVVRFFHYAETFLCDGRLLVAGQQDAEALRGSTADTSAKLMELRKPEPLGVFDDHQRSIRDIDADLDYGCRDKDVQFARDELLHYLVFVDAFHFAVQKADAPVWKDLVAKLLEHYRRGFQVEFFGFFDQRVHDIDLSAEADFALDTFVNAVSLILADHDRFYRRAAWREFVDDGNVEIAVNRHRE